MLEVKHLAKRRRVTLKVKMTAPLAPVILVMAIKTIKVMRVTRTTIQKAQIKTKIASSLTKNDFS